MLIPIGGFPNGRHPRNKSDEFSWKYQFIKMNILTSEECGKPQLRTGFIAMPTRHPLSVHFGKRFITLDILWVEKLCSEQTQIISKNTDKVSMHVLWQVFHQKPWPYSLYPPRTSSSMQEMKYCIRARNVTTAFNLWHLLYELLCVKLGDQPLYTMHSLSVLVSCNITTCL